MNKKGELTFQSMIYGVLVLGLLFGVFGYIIQSIEPNYDATNLDKTALEDYQVMENISTVLNSASDDIDKVNADKDAFDFFSDVWSKITTPFKTIYRSIKTFKNVSVAVVRDLSLPSIFSDFLTTIITLFVIIGLVMIKYYMGRNK